MRKTGHRGVKQLSCGHTAGEQCWGFPHFNTHTLPPSKVARTKKDMAALSPESLEGECLGHRRDTRHRCRIVAANPALAITAGFLEEAQLPHQELLVQ